MRWTDFLPLVFTMNRTELALVIPFWMFIGIAIATHEAAHAAVGAALGMRPRRVLVGVGPERWCWRTTIRGVPVSAGPFLLLGVADFEDPQPPHPPLARIAMTLAGPAANLALGAAMLVLLNGHAAAILHGLGRMILDSPRLIASAIALSIRDPRAALASDGTPVTPLTFLNLCGLISFGLGLVNLAPFWPLDGGNVLVALADALGLSSNLIRASLVVTGIAGVTVLMLPTFILFPWLSLIGTIAITLAIGLPIRLWMDLSRRRRGAAPQPPADGRDPMSPA